jgi:hypothetical protein
MLQVSIMDNWPKLFCSCRLTVVIVYKRHREGAYTTVPIGNEVVKTDDSTVLRSRLKVMSPLS